MRQSGERRAPVSLASRWHVIRLSNSQRRRIFSPRSHNTVFQPIPAVRPAIVSIKVASNARRREHIVKQKITRYLREGANRKIVRSTRRTGERDGAVSNFFNEFSRSGCITRSTVREHEIAGVPIQ